VGLTTLHLKNKLVRKYRRSIGPGRVPWINDLSERKCILVGKSEGKRPLGRPSRRWVGKIKIDLREIGWDYVD
jgi:hypothetical protein